MIMHLQRTCGDNSDETGCSAGPADCNFNNGIASCAWKQMTGDDMDWSIASAQSQGGFTIQNGK